MKKILLILFLGVFLISFVSAQIQSLGTFRLGDDVNLIQTCDNCTFNNITSVLYPNSTQTVGEFEMTKRGTIYNFTLSADNVTEIGTYIVNGFGDLDGVDTVWNYNFEITSFGTKVSNPGIIYAVLLLIIFGMDILVFFLIYTLGSENHRNEEGEFIGISLKKYVRIILIGISYGLILLTLNLMNAMATTTSEITQFAGTIGGIFSAMLSVAWVWTVIIIIYMGKMAWKDGNLIKEIEERINEAQSHHP